MMPRHAVHRWVFGVALLASATAHADGFNPELSVRFLGIVSLDVITTDTFGTRGTNVGVGFADSGVELGSRLRLRPNLIAGVDAGFQFPDDGENQGEVFFHLARVTLANQWLTVMLGRSSLHNNMVRLPTLRDDDLIQFEYVQNPFSDGVTTQDQQYGNILGITLWYDYEYFLDLHAEHLLVTDPNLDNPQFDINALGAGLGFRRTQYDENLHVLRLLGASMEAIRVNVPGQTWEWNVTGGFSLFAWPDPVHRLLIDGQVIFNAGVDGAALVNLQSLATVRNVSSVGSLAYVFYKQEEPRARAAFAFGHRAWFEGGKNARQLSIIGNAFYVLGRGFDVGAQYQLLANSDGLATVLGAPQYTHTVQIAVRAQFDFVWNALPVFNTPLNVQYGYTPR